MDIKTATAEERKSRAPLALHADAPPPAGSAGFAARPVVWDPKQVMTFMSLPSEDQARRFIAKLPETVRVVNVGRRVLVNAIRLLDHLGFSEQERRDALGQR